MKQIIVTALLSLAISGCKTADNTRTSQPSLSPEEVTAEIASLRKVIVPPNGWNKADVDWVFGAPEETKELNGKGSTAMYPMHSYQLIPPKQGQQFRAFLYVTYRNDKVHFAGINHMCVVKGRYKEPEPDELDREHRFVLTDLLEIKKKYEHKLKDATWNKKASEPEPERDGKPAR
jgi:hypothetical protein